jgi:hypothetical protein
MGLSSVSRRDNNKVGLFDWLGKSRRAPESATTWQVHRDGGDVVVQDGRGASYRASLTGVRSVRVVPLTGGQQHAQVGAGWQVTLAHADGDALVGKPMPDWRAARDLARLLCDKTELPLDELTEKMFSRVGQFTPAGDT